MDKNFSLLRSFGFPSMLTAIGLLVNPAETAGQCGDPTTGDCFDLSGKPYCDDHCGGLGGCTGCCETVCAFFSSCCTFEWDVVCAMAAMEVCVPDPPRPAFEYDLWLRELKFEVLPSPSPGPSTTNVSAEVVTIAITAVPDDVLVRIRQIRDKAVFQEATFTIDPSLTEQTFTTQFDLLETDRVDAVIEHDDFNVENNTLACISKCLVCGDFDPIFSITFDTGQQMVTVTVVCDSEETAIRRTWYWPHALILLPPYNRHEVNGAEGSPPCPDPKDPQDGVLVGSAFGFAAANGMLIEGSAGTTSGAAIESGIAFGDVARISVGQQISDMVDSSHGTGWERSRSREFSARTNTEDGYLFGLRDTTVVVVQTEYRVAQYRVVSDNAGSQYVGQQFWIGVPVTDGNRSNPSLVDVSLAEYQELRHEEAPLLLEGHEVGDLQTYRTEAPHDVECHILFDSIVEFESISFANATVGTSSGGANFGSSILQWSGSTETVTRSTTNHGEGEISLGLIIGGGSSFGDQEGFSHQVYETATAEYNSFIGRVCDTVDHRFELWHYAANVTFEYTPPPPYSQRLATMFIMCYFVVDPPIEGNSDSTPCEPVEPPMMCIGDCQSRPDGQVGIVDFLELLGQWGGPGSCDIDNGGVGITDFLTLLANWGPCP